VELLRNGCRLWRTPEEALESVRGGVLLLAPVDRVRRHAVPALGESGQQHVEPARRRIAERERRIGTGELNRVIAEIAERTPPPTYKGRAVKIRYVTQGSTRPPTFIFFTNLPQGLPPSYRRFLAHRLRERYGFAGTPIRVLFRQGSGREAAGSGGAGGGGR